MVRFRALAPEDRSNFSIFVEALGLNGDPVFGWSPGDFFAEFSRGEAWGAEDDGQIVAALIPRARAAAPATVEVEILSLVTHPKRRRQGHMRGLLAAYVASLPAGAKIWLEVHEANGAALAFYKAYGFQQVGRRPRYYRDQGAALLLEYKPLQSL